MKKTVTILLLVFTFGAYAQKFNVSFSSTVLDQPFSGEILLYLSKDHKSPKDIFVGMNLVPVYRISAQDLKPDEQTTFDDQAISYPVALSDIERGSYNVQVVFDRNLGGQNIGDSPGNLFSTSMKANFTKDVNAAFSIVADQVVSTIEMKETKFLKELSVPSKLLSDFHDKEMFIGGGVSLPEEYFDNPTADYPVIFSVFGFGANYRLHSGLGKYKFSSLGGSPVIVVYLDGNCSEGHSTYANSDINGPWGDALVKEFLPALQQKYRASKARFLFGHSSGGWTVLWLQINYPKVFSGAWSSAPDPVDFRKVQLPNIYEDKNLYYNTNGQLNSAVTIAGSFPVTSTKDFYQSENVIYRGGQMHSFDAVFSSRDENGNVVRLANSKTGEINTEAVSNWRRYDISLLLREDWKEDLNGKMRISIGESDNFHLTPPVRLLEKEMKKLNAKIEFGYFPGDHFTVFTPDYQQKGQAFLDRCYEAWLAQ